MMRMLRSALTVSSAGSKSIQSRAFTALSFRTRGYAQSFVRASLPCSKISPTPASQRYASVQSSDAGRSAADEVAEELQELYAIAKDEFEIATESTEAHATYAVEDRAAARDELAKLVAKWEEVLEHGGEVAENLKKRPFGQRIRELTAAIEELNKKDYED